MENMEIYNKFKMPPQEALKTIGGGRLKGMTDIRPQWRIEALTTLFGACGDGWYYKTTQRWTESHAAEVSVHVAIDFFYKINGEFTAVAVEGIGGAVILANETKGFHHSDEAYKMATTDALSVVCKQLGIASDVYLGKVGKIKDTSKYEKKEYDWSGIDKKEPMKPLAPLKMVKIEDEPIQKNSVEQPKTNKYDKALDFKFN